MFRRERCRKTKYTSRKDARARIEEDDSNNGKSKEAVSPGSGVYPDQDSSSNEHEEHNNERAHYPAEGSEAALQRHVDEEERHVGDLREDGEEVLELLADEGGASLELLVVVRGGSDEHVPGQ